MNRKLMFLFAVMLLLGLSTVMIIAQDDPDPAVPDGAPIELEGAIEDVIDAETIILGGLTVNVANIDVTIIQQLDVNVEINISGVLAGGVVYAQTIIIIIVPEVPVPEATAETTPEAMDDVITIEKYVATADDITWQDADDAPGPEAPIDSDVNFRIVVTNTGTEPLTSITLADAMVDTSSCVIPETLEVDTSFECVLGPAVVAEGQNTNTATVTALAGDTSVEASDSANYFGGIIDDDSASGGVIIVVEGPVIAININVITIYDFDIVLAEDDPLLSVIVVGDIIRVEGLIDELGTFETDVNITIVIVAVTIIFVDIDVFILDGDIWRDSGNCSNPPPPWAPANGWRRRCEGGRGSGSGSGSGSGR